MKEGGPGDKSTITNNQTSKIAVLQKSGDNYAKKIHRETTKIKDLDAQIKVVQKKIEAQRHILK